MTSEQNDLRQSARQVLQDLGVAPDEDAVDARVVELGWLLVGAPEDLGGLGLGLECACAVYTELGRGLAGAPYVAAMIALDAICAGAAADQAGWVERVAAGEHVAAPLAASALSRSASGSRLNGVVSAVPSADRASHVLAFSGDTVALVPLSLAGVTLSARQAWDRTRRLFDVRFEEVALDSQLVLATGADAAALSRRIVAHREFALACDAVGGATALLEVTVDYLQTRKQFGRPLAMFQALKHRCADLKVQTAAAEALLFDSLHRAAASAGDNVLLAKTAKFLACSTFAKVAEEAIQLHGGIAMTSEHVCHLFVKRALLNQHLGAQGDAYETHIAASILSDR